MGEGNSEFSKNQSVPERSPAESSKSFLEKAITSAKQALQLVENKTGLTKAGILFMTAFDFAAVAFVAKSIESGSLDSTEGIIRTLGGLSSAVGANYLILGGSRRFFPHRYEQLRDERGRFTKRSK